MLFSSNSVVCGGVCSMREENVESEMSCWKKKYYKRTIWVGWGKDSKQKVIHIIFWIVPINKAACHPRRFFVFIK